MKILYPSLSISSRVEELHVDHIDNRFSFELFYLKVGAPPEIASLLDEIRRENDVYNKHDHVNSCVGADPELDEFMVKTIVLNDQFSVNKLET